MSNRPGPHRSEGLGVRLLGPFSAVTLVALVAVGVFLLRAVEDRRLSEASRRDAEAALAALRGRERDARAEPRRVPDPPPEPPPAEPAPVEPARTESAPVMVATLPPASAPPRKPEPEPEPPKAPADDAERTRLLAEIAELRAELAKRTVPAPRPLAPEPRPDHVEEALRREVDRALEALARSPGAASDARDAVAIGPIVLPLLARHFRDPEKGPPAIRMAGTLPGVRVDAFLAAFSGSACAGPAHRDAAAAALASLARAGGADAVIAAASSPDLGPEAGLAAVAAAAELDHPRAAEAIAAALRRSPAEQKLATSLLADRGTGGREALAAALGGGRLTPDAALLVLAALLPDAHAAEGRMLGRAILDHDGAAAVALDAPIGQEAAPGIASELLAAGLTPERSALLAHLLGREAGAPDPELFGAAFALPGLSEALQEIARERGRTLPSTVQALQARAREAQPLDAPDLIAALDAADPADRAAVAAAAARLGHPEGASVLRRLACHLDPQVRAAAVAAIEQAELRASADVLTRALLDEDAEVAAAAAWAIDALKLDVDPATGVAALASLPQPHSELVLSAMERREGTREASTALLIDALDRAAVADVHAAARCLFRLNEGGGSDFASRFLGHHEPLVRAAAVAAAAEHAGPDRDRWLSVVERISADPDPLVRVATARALGRVRDDIARARLVALVRDPDWLVREAALLGLANQDKLNLIPVLRRAQQDPEPMVANAARVALVRHGMADVAPALVEDLGDPAVAGRSRAALLALVGARDLDESGLAAAVEKLTGTASRPR